MRIKSLILVSLSLGVLLLTSCVTPRRVDYLQDMTHGSQVEIENRFEAVIAPYDQLSITVMSSDMKNADLAAPFNMTKGQDQRQGRQGTQPPFQHRMLLQSQSSGWEIIISYDGSARPFLPPGEDKTLQSKGGTGWKIRGR